MAEYKLIPIELLDEPDLPIRLTVDHVALEDLAEDIKLNGVIEPLIVAERNGRYHIWAGHRRFLAARMAYLRELPCLIRQESELPSEAVMLSENFLRADVSAASVGRWVLMMVEKYKLSMDDLCQRLRRSEAWIQERVDLVECDPVVAAAVEANAISFAVSKQLCRCKDEAHRRYLLKMAIDHGCTARTMQFQVDQWKAGLEQPRSPGQAVNVVTTQTEQPANAPHCVLCGVPDSPQNMIQLLVHYYHWEPIKKFLIDQGIDVRG